MKEVERETINQLSRCSAVVRGRKMNVVQVANVRV